jgi:hypothetical protein
LAQDIAAGGLKRLIKVAVRSGRPDFELSQLGDDVSPGGLPSSGSGFASLEGVASQKLAVTTQLLSRDRGDR